MAAVAELGRAVEDFDSWRRQQLRATLDQLLPQLTRSVRARRRLRRGRRGALVRDGARRPGRSQVELAAEKLVGALHRAATASCSAGTRTCHSP